MNITGESHTFKATPLGRRSFNCCLPSLHSPSWWKPGLVKVASQEKLKLRLRVAEESLRLLEFLRLRQLNLLISLGLKSILYRASCHSSCQCRKLNIRFSSRLPAKQTGCRHLPRLVQHQAVAIQHRRSLPLTLMTLHHETLVRYCSIAIHPPNPSRVEVIVRKEKASS